jgi:restriction endonuclease Mrr
MGFDRVLFVTNGTLELGARQKFANHFPTNVEVVDVDALAAWAATLADAEPKAKTVEAVIKELSRTLARMIAETPNALDKVEWRDLERIVCAVFEGLGFDAELTPPAKDGGKDIILRCWPKGKKTTYAVEIKHWRKKKVGQSTIRSFVDVIVRDQFASGVLLATDGFSSNVYQHLSEIERQILRLGTRTKIVSLCQTYTRTKGGILSPPSLPEILFEGTK